MIKSPIVSALIIPLSSLLFISCGGGGGEGAVANAPTSNFVHEGATVLSTCATCTAETGQTNTNDGNDSSAYSSTFPAAVGSGTVSVRVDAIDGASFPAGEQVGARLGFPTIPSSTITITINLYLGNTLVESSMPPLDNAGVGLGSTIDDFTFVSSQAYDAVEVVFQYATATPPGESFSIQVFEFRG